MYIWSYHHQIRRTNSYRKMGSLSNTNKRLFGHNQTITPCTRFHQIGALALVVTTFFLTRLFDLSSLSSCNSNSADLSSNGARLHAVHFSDVGSLSWPETGYGSDLSLKIYVYDENEIDGLGVLLCGRDGKISADACVKGQWGTQNGAESKKEDELIIKTAKKLATAGHGMKLGFSPPQSLDEMNNCPPASLSDILLYIEETVCSCSSLGFVATAGSTIAESIELMREHQPCSG